MTTQVRCDSAKPLDYPTNSKWVQCDRPTHDPDSEVGHMAVKRNADLTPTGKHYEWVGTDFGTSEMAGNPPHTCWLWPSVPARVYVQTGPATEAQVKALTDLVKAGVIAQP